MRNRIYASKAWWLIALTLKASAAPFYKIWDVISSASLWMMQAQVDAVKQELEIAERLNTYVSDPGYEP